MDQSVVAGGVGGVAIVITTKIIQKFHESFTAEGRVQALHTLFLAVETRHNHFVHKLLPQIEPPYRNDEEFQGVENYTKIIAVEGSRKDNLMGEICNSGLYRYSPTFKKEEIEEIARRLRRVDEDTWRSSSRATKIIDMSSSNGEETKLVVEGDDDNGDTVIHQVVLRNIAPPATCNPANGSGDPTEEEGGTSV